MTTTPAEALRRARAAIARCVLGNERQLDVTIGSIVLRSHQQAAAARMLALIEANGGALLADPVGLGKTYTALAVARHWHNRLVVVPASLRDMWRNALAATGLDAQIVTHEALSRGRLPTFAADIVVIDEAHRLRSTCTRRYAAIADLCSRIPVLLLTATPIHNRRDDLAAQLALFLGRSAWQQSAEQLAAHVVRDSASAEVRELPALDGPQALTLDCEDDCLDELVALPPPIPASDEGTAGALFTYTLVHQWASSQAALVAALKRRLARALALRSAIDGGRRPTRRELAAWSYADDALQLAFPEIVASPPSDRDPSLDELRAAIDGHTNALVSLIAHLHDRTNVDAKRAAMLRRIRARHPTERIIAFCQYAETVDALYRLLAREPGVAALTSHGARVAGGRLPRRELLAQFTPEGSSRPVRAAERIDLLLTTDLLSEGLNLQEASVVVHLDLPWNPARLDQRVGRVRRLGSRHGVIAVYAFSPPASTERLLRIESRLREKLRVAQQTVGVAGRILPSPFGAASDQSESGLAEELGDIHAALRMWVERIARPIGQPVVGGVAAPVPGWLAVVEDERGTTLVVDLGHGIETTAASIRIALDYAAGTAAACEPADAREALARLDHWIATRRGAASIDFRAASTARSRRAALARVTTALARAPHHRRAALAPLAAAARAVVTASLTEGAERVLDTLVRAQLPDEAWLRSLAAFGQVNAKPRADTLRDARVAAIIVFCPTTSSSPHGRSEDETQFTAGHPP